MDETMLAWEAELALLRTDTRRDPAALDEYLDSTFHEIGQLGRHWVRLEIIRDLNAAPSVGDGRVFLDEQRADALGAGLILLTYRLHASGELSRRSSLWRVTAGKPMILFHQGTPIGKGSEGSDGN